MAIYFIKQMISMAVFLIFQSMVLRLKESIG